MIIHDIIKELPEGRAMTKAYVLYKAAEDAKERLNGIECTLSDLLDQHEDDLAMADNGYAIKCILSNIMYVAQRAAEEMEEMLQ